VRSRRAPLAIAGNSQYAANHSTRLQTGCCLSVQGVEARHIGSIVAVLGTETGGRDPSYGSVNQAGVTIFSLRLRGSIDQVRVEPEQAAHETGAVRLADESWPGSPAALEGA
jgi:hypothetical protein